MTSQKYSPSSAGSRSEMMSCEVYMESASEKLISYRPSSAMGSVIPDLNHWKEDGDWLLMTVQVKEALSSTKPIVGTGLCTMVTAAA